MNSYQVFDFRVDKLYFIALDEQPYEYKNVHLFSVDQQLVYVNFYMDFGPSNLGQVVRFCELVQDKFQNPVLQGKTLVLYSSMDIDRRCNAAFLMACYMLLVHKKTPEEAHMPLMSATQPFVPYRDAGYGAATYHLTILDCLKGLHKSLMTGLLDLQSFDTEQYEFYEKVENGDFNWITPKFLALACPKEEQSPLQVQQKMTKRGQILRSCYQMDNLIKFMLDNNIKTIVRLNNKTYDKRKFVEAGIEHIELYFPDGTTPADGILKKFLEVCESRPGPIAVHCKAGLGRTGTLIAAYLMKNYKLTACETIAFLRVVRPGSVVGPQQNYLQAMQTRIWKMPPQQRLPPQISMWQPPTYPNQLTRFGPPPFSFSALPVHQKSHSVPVTFGNRMQSDDLDTQHNISFVRDGDPYALEIERERQEQSAIALEDLMIPLQPRKQQRMV
ncbi:dual specificity protein phosphatase [Gorgonomyces haynaldii]|nr:dual specificity protein phosphatase [Gorgonomyces haynaldii]